eukprot:GHUV01026514.1.p1 GENE.GHUV01026514.1~~GHUV01026514.1.p1  ORF type:complete len:133 (+),score=21.44 GHUV01026514.1:850-1248(+)
MYYDCTDLTAAGVTGLDMCVRRPLVATCSTDHTVRLWNYADRSCDLNKLFAEEAYSVAIHPTGLMVRRVCSSMCCRVCSSMGCVGKLLAVVETHRQGHVGMPSCSGHSYINTNSADAVLVTTVVAVKAGRDG